jgi:hypothetical protein
VTLEFLVSTLLGKTSRSTVQLMAASLIIGCYSSYALSRETDAGSGALLYWSRWTSDLVRWRVLFRTNSSRSNGAAYLRGGESGVPELRDVVGHSRAVKQPLAAQGTFASEVLYWLALSRQHGPHIYCIIMDVRQTFANSKYKMVYSKPEAYF